MKFYQAPLVSGPKILLPNIDISLSYTPTSTFYEGTLFTTGNFGDAVLVSGSNSTVDSGALLSVTTSQTGLYYNIENLSPDIMTLTGLDIERVSNGIGLVKLTTTLNSRILSVPVSRTSSSISVSLLGYSDNTVADLSCSEVDAIINGETPSTTTQNLFVNYLTYPCTRSTTCIFSNELDFTGIAAKVITGIGYNYWHGTLVTPQDIIMAAHNSPGNGTVITFIDASNNHYSRTISSGATITGTDIRVLRLDSALPGSIKFYKVLPANIVTKMPFSCPQSASQIVNYSHMNDVPVLQKDQQERIYIGRLGQLEYPGENLIKIYSSNSRNSWYKFPISGDSGGPIFLVINGELILISCWLSSYTGPSIHKYITEINSALSSMGSSYTLTIVDLSSFTSF